MNNKNKKNFVDLYLREVNNIKKNSNNPIVYSLFPKSNDYYNQHRDCRNKALLSVESFLSEPTFTDYAKKLATIQAEYVLDPVHPDHNAIFEKYSYKSMFVEGANISTEIMKYALSSKDGQKSSVILVVGGHSITISLDNHNNKIKIGYYDPSFGQLYLQISDKKEIKKAFEDKDFKFTNPFSILNPNNILLGKAISMRDEILDENLPITLITFIDNETKTSNLPSYSKIAFAENLLPNNVIKVIAKNLAMLPNIKQAVGKQAFQSFLKDYKELLSQNSDNFLGCIKLLEKKNNYYKEVLSLPKKVTLELYKLDDVYSPVPHSRYKPSNICLKEASYDPNLLKAETKFFKLIHEDKVAIYEEIKECMLLTPEIYKILNKRKSSDIFNDKRQLKYDEYKNTYYDMRDHIRGSKTVEVCFDDAKTFDLIEQMLGADSSLVKSEDL